jgi:hypothetical protein
MASKDSRHPAAIWQGDVSVNRGRMPLLRISSPNREFDLFVPKNKAPHEPLTVLSGTAVSPTRYFLSSKLHPTPFSEMIDYGRS